MTSSPSPFVLSYRRRRKSLSASAEDDFELPPLTHLSTDASSSPPPRTPQLSPRLAALEIDYFGRRASSSSSRSHGQRHKSFGNEVFEHLPPIYSPTFSDDEGPSLAFSSISSPPPSVYPDEEVESTDEEDVAEDQLGWTMSSARSTTFQTSDERGHCGPGIMPPDVAAFPPPRFIITRSPLSDPPILSPPRSSPLGLESLPEPLDSKSPMPESGAALREQHDIDGSALTRMNPSSPIHLESSMTKDPPPPLTSPRLRSTSPMSHHDIALDLLPSLQPPNVVDSPVLSSSPTPPLLDSTSSDAQSAEDARPVLLESDPDLVLADDEGEDMDISDAEEELDAKAKTSSSAMAESLSTPVESNVAALCTCDTLPSDLVDEDAPTDAAHSTELMVADPSEAIVKNVQVASEHIASDEAVATSTSPSRPSPTSREPSSSPQIDFPMPPLEGDPMDALSPLSDLDVAVASSWGSPISSAPASPLVASPLQLVPDVTVAETPFSPSTSDAAPSSALPSREPSLPPKGQGKEKKRPLGSTHNQPHPGAAPQRRASQPDTGASVSLSDIDAEAYAQSETIEKRKGGDQGTGPAKKKPKLEVERDGKKGKGKAKIRDVEGDGQPNGTKPKAGKRKPSPAQASGRRTSPSSPSPPSKDDAYPELPGLLIETLAAARASSLPAPAATRALLQTRPNLAQLRPEKEWVGIVRETLEAGVGGVFGKVDIGAGTDDADYSVEPQYFYDPDHDDDRDRAGLVMAMFPRPAKRTATRTAKRYYWKPLGKMTRWDREDDL